VTGYEIRDHGPVKPRYGTPEREAYDREHGGPADHSTCNNGGKRVRCDRCGDEFVCTPQRDLYCTPQGDHSCEPCLMSSAGVTEMHVINLREPRLTHLDDDEGIAPNAGSTS
jgi:hypothetical protein